jgi:hypothetical protein
MAYAGCFVRGSSVRTAALVVSTVAAALSTGACDGGDERESTSACKATRTVISADDVTPLGFSGAQLLATAEGSYTGALTWEAVNASEVTTNVTPGQTTLSLRIARNGEIRLLDQENNGPTTIACLDGIEAQVEVHATTADGLLAETREGMLVGWSPNESHFSIDFEGAPPTGTLRAEAAPASGLTLAFFNLAGTFSATGTKSGLIILGVEGRTSEAVFLKNVTLGAWSDLTRTPAPSP